MSDKLEGNLVVKALEQVLYSRKPSRELIHHSDRENQYTSNEFKELTNQHDIKLSMSGKGHCYDNAVAKSFFHTLKREKTFLYDYRIRKEVEVDVFEYIEVFYNHKRLHSTLGYKFPVDFEKVWKSCEVGSERRHRRASPHVACQYDASERKGCALSIEKRTVARALSQCNT